MATTTAAATRPADLDQRIARALRGDASAEEVASLIPEVEAAATATREAAHRARERALDPILTGRDATAARAEQDGAAFVCDRLSAAVDRLRERREELRQSGEDDRRRAEYEHVRAERDRVAAELAAVYPEAVAKLVDLMRRLAACDERVEQVNRALPTGAEPLQSAELQVRGPLARPVGPDVSRLARALRLPILRPGQHGSRYEWPIEPAAPTHMFAPQRPQRGPVS